MRVLKTLFKMLTQAVCISTAFVGSVYILNIAHNLYVQEALAYASN